MEFREVVATALLTVVLLLFAVGSSAKRNTTDESDPVADANAAIVNHEILRAVSGTSSPATTCTRAFTLFVPAYIRSVEEAYEFVRAINREILAVHVVDAKVAVGDFQYFRKMNGLPSLEGNFTVRVTGKNSIMKKKIARGNLFVSKHLIIHSIHSFPFSSSTSESRQLHYEEVVKGSFFSSTLNAAMYTWKSVGSFVILLALFNEAALRRFIAPYLPFVVSGGEEQVVASGGGAEEEDADAARRRRQQGANRTFKELIVSAVIVSCLTYFIKATEALGSPSLD